MYRRFLGGGMYRVAVWAGGIFALGGVFVASQFRTVYSIHADTSQKIVVADFDSCTVGGEVPQEQGQKKEKVYFMSCGGLID